MQENSLRHIRPRFAKGFFISNENWVQNFWIEKLKCSIFWGISKLHEKKMEKVFRMLMGWYNGLTVHNSKVWDFFYKFRMLSDALKHFEINIEIEKNEFFEALKSCVKKLEKEFWLQMGWGNTVNRSSINGQSLGSFLECFLRLWWNYYLKQKH